MPHPKSFVNVIGGNPQWRLRPQTMRTRHSTVRYAECVMKCVVNNVWASRRNRPLYAQIKCWNLRGNFVQRTLPLSDIWLLSFFFVIICFFFPSTMCEKPKFLRSTDDIIPTGIHFLIYREREFPANRDFCSNFQSNVRLRLINTRRTYANAHWHANCIRRTTRIRMSADKNRLSAGNCQWVSLARCLVAHESSQIVHHIIHDIAWSFINVKSIYLVRHPFVRDTNQLNWQNVNWSARQGFCNLWR